LKVDVVTLDFQVDQAVPYFFGLNRGELSFGTLGLLLLKAEFEHVLFPELAVLTVAFVSKSPDAPAELVHRKLEH